mgnify:CR=1 FL=1
MLFHHSALAILTRHIRLIIAVGLLAALVSLLVSLFFPLEYRADAQVLIISQSRSGVDPYTVVKSAERVGENVSAVMKTNDFFEKVTRQEGYTLDLSRFENIPERVKRKRWQKTVESSVVYGTGVLGISAYHEDAEQAAQFAGAAADTLAARGWEYVGGDVTIKVVNRPVATRFPVRPNLLANAVLGFLSGIILVYILLLKRG